MSISEGKEAVNAETARNMQKIVENVERDKPREAALPKKGLQNGLVWSRELRESRMMRR